MFATMQGALELVDCRSVLPTFTRRPGITTWAVLDDLSSNRAKRMQTKRQSKPIPTLAEGTPLQLHTPSLKTLFERNMSGGDDGVASIVAAGSMSGGDRVLVVWPVP